MENGGSRRVKCSASRAFPIHSPCPNRTPKPAAWPEMPCRFPWFKPQQKALFMQSPKLRGSFHIVRGPWPIGQIPDEVVIRIVKHLIHHLFIGKKDIDGDTNGDVLATGVDGEHRASPLGVVDVVRNGCGWSVKTVVAPAPMMRNEFA